MAESFGFDAPVITDAADGPSITTGLRFGVLVDGTIDGISAYAPAVSVGDLIFHLFEVTDQAVGTLLASKTVAGTVGTLVTATFDTPVPVTADRAYLAAVYNVTGHYVATIGAFSAGNVTVGNLVAYQTGSSPFGSALSNGAFIYSADAYPTSSGGGANFGLDVSFSAGAAELVTGVGSAKLGGLTGAAAATVTYSGAGSATLGGMLGAGTGNVGHRGRGTSMFGGLAGEAQSEGRQPIPAAVSGGSWYGLLAIIQEARQVREEDATRPLIDCPQCGGPLDQARGALHCPFDGSIYG